MIKISSYKKTRLRLSPSSISCYNWCSYKYKLRYIDKIKSKVVVPWLEKGKVIHSEIEKYYKTFPKKEVNLKIIEKHKNSIDIDLYKKYKEHFDSFISLNKGIFNNISEKYFFPLAVEEKLYDERLDVVGIIDAVYSDGVNNLILDFKTGKPHPHLTTQDKFQLAVYKHLWDLYHPQERISHWCHFYTRNSLSENNPLIQKVREKDMLNMYKMIDETKANILSGIFIKSKNNWKCGRCEYMEKCFW